MIHQTSAPYAALVLRVALGTMFIAHGLLKVLVFTLPGTVSFFQSVGLPGVMAYGVIALELAAGVLLIAGVATRWVALVTIPVLLGAAWVHFPNGWLFTAKGGGWEYPVFLAVAALVQALLGDGAFALAQPWQNKRTTDQLAAMRM
jgi:putative oxidoreductase